MKVLYKHHEKGLTTKLTRGGYTFEDGKDYDLPDELAKSLKAAFPLNFIDMGKQKPKQEEESVKDAPDKMVNEDKPKTKKKGQ